MAACDDLPTKRPTPNALTLPSPASGRGEKQSIRVESVAEDHIGRISTNVASTSQSAVTGAVVNTLATSVPPQPVTSPIR